MFDEPFSSEIFACVLLTYIRGFKNADAKNKNRDVKSRYQANQKIQTSKKANNFNYYMTIIQLLLSSFWRKIECKFSKMFFVNNV